MTTNKKLSKEEKKLILLKDLCARIPHHVKVEYRKSKAVDLTDYLRSVNLAACKPQLRPISSMTEEERNEYKRIAPGIVFDEGIKFPNISQLDWLLSNHFDFRCLISLGLANEVTKENNPYK